MIEGGIQVGTDRAVAILRRMLEIPSPSGEEAALARFLVATMRELGFDAYVDAAGNAVGAVGAGGPTIMLLGHMDTVPGQVPVRQSGGVLYGRGAVDAKGPLATMICAAAVAAGDDCRLLVVGAVEEETPGSRGAHAIREQHPPPAALLIGEPSGWSSVVLGYKGKVDLAYQVRQPAAHPTRPGPVASELATQCWGALLELVPAAADASFDNAAARLDAISGTFTTARAEFSIRTPVGFELDKLLTEMNLRVPTGELSVVNAVPACRVERRDPVVRALSAAIRQHGGSATPVLRAGTSDMNTLAEVWTVPMAAYGPGDNHLDHSDHEYVAVADYLRAISVLSSGIRQLAAGWTGRPARDAG